MSKNYNFAPQPSAIDDDPFGNNHLLGDESRGFSDNLNASSWDQPTETGFSGFGEELPATANAYTSTQESGVGERLRELKDKVMHGMGRRALEAVMNKLPDFGGKKDTLQNFAVGAFEDPSQILRTQQAATEAWGSRDMYQNQAISYAKTAGLEVAGAGMLAAKETAMKYYGLEKDENEKLRIARKMKFGRAVLKTVLNPVGTASSVGARSAHAARKAVKQEAVSQYKTGRENVINLPSRLQQSPTDAYPNVVGF